jgi:hypothetical protein
MSTISERKGILAPDWDMTPYSLVDIYQLSGGTPCPDIPAGRWVEYFPHENFVNILLDYRTSRLTEVKLSFTLGFGG